MRTVSQCQLFALVVLCVVLFLSVPLGNCQLALKPLKPRTPGHFRLPHPTRGSSIGCIRGSARHIAPTDASNYEECVAECRTSERCHYFSFTAWGCLHVPQRPETSLVARYTDVIFCPVPGSTPTPPTMSPPTSTIGTSSTPGPNDATSRASLQPVCIEHGIVWRGTTIAFVYVDPINSIRDCQAFCMERVGCQYFVTDGSRSCYLQNMRRHGQYANPGWTSATADCPLGAAGVVGNTKSTARTSTSTSTPMTTTTTTTSDIDMTTDLAGSNMSSDPTTLTDSTMDTTISTHPATSISSETTSSMLSTRSPDDATDGGVGTSPGTSFGTTATFTPTVLHHSSQSSTISSRTSTSGEWEMPVEGMESGMVNHEAPHIDTTTSTTSTSTSSMGGGLYRIHDDIPHRPLRRRKPACEFADSKWVGPALKHVHLEDEYATPDGCQQECREKDACRYFMLRWPNSCYLLAHQIGLFKTSKDEHWMAATAHCELKGGHYYNGKDISTTTTTTLAPTTPYVTSSPYASTTPTTSTMTSTTTTPSTTATTTTTATTATTTTTTTTTTTSVLSKTTLLEETAVSSDTRDNTPSPTDLRDSTSTELTTTTTTTTEPEYIEDEEDIPEDILRELER